MAERRFVHTPTEVAREFLRAISPRMDFTGPRMDNPPDNDLLFANLCWHLLQRERKQESLRAALILLTESPIVGLALMVAQFKTHLTSGQERFVLLTSARLHEQNRQTELSSIELTGSRHYGKLKALTYNREIPEGETYTDRLKTDINTLQNLQRSLLAEKPVPM